MKRSFNFINIIALYFIFTHIIISCKQHSCIPKKVYSCLDSTIICNNDDLIGKIFYKSDSINYPTNYSNVFFNKMDIKLADSLIKSYVILQSKTTDKIKNNYKYYFKQYLPYKDLKDNITYIKITYNINTKSDYVFKYWTLVDDGGDGFFYIKFDWINKKVIDYQIN